ncbi:MAG: DUF2935 domain-containing protein [Firmicutes bacterium]|jgi:hypothetical protein|nr:DUF2935 domain-containing protein [Bacillota bacterium]
MEQENQVVEEFSRHNDIVTNGRLQEIRFWVTIMKEHALFIALGLPCDQTKLIAEAQSFVQQFKELEEKVKNAKIIDPWLLEKIRSAVRALIAFQLGLLALMLQCKIRPAIFPLFIDHITREAVHFLELLEKPQQPLSSIEQMLRRAVFWLRQMKEHIEFIIHLLDPSERLLINQADALLAVFRDLLETARDLESMSKSDPRFFNAAVRFIFEVNDRTNELRDFKATAHELVVLCRVLSIIPDPLLTDHVRREADKFLKELEEFKSVTNVCKSLEASEKPHR